MTSRVEVLVVEDESVVREAARKILEEEGLSIATVNDTGEALAFLEHVPCRLVLTDLKLPGASGFDLLESIRSRWPATEVVVVTGYSTLENALSTFRKGAFDFVAKPFEIGELLGVVERALRFSRRNEVGSAAQAVGRTAELVTPSGPAGDLSPVERAFFLGRHSWARLQDDGAATLGVAETFPNLMDDIETIELPAPGDPLRQGRLCARMITPGEVVHLVWSPLSGTVLATNPQLRDSSERLDRDPYGEGWLLRIIPDNLDAELALLDSRRYRRE